MKLSPILFLVFITLGFTNAYAQGQYRIQIIYQNAVMSKSDSFEFALGSDRVTIDWNNRSVFFAGRFSTGQRYTVSQRSGTRTCTFTGNSQIGTIANEDVTIGVQCGFPPRVNGTFTVTGIEQGERFLFANEYGNSYYATINKAYPIHNFPIGDNYVFRQTEGPRPCRMTNATGVVPNSPLEISADCSRSGGTGNLRLGVTYGSSLFSTKERFEFSIGGGDTIVLKNSARQAQFARLFSPGQNYSVSQIFGPRTCRFLGANNGTFANQDISLMVDCGSPPIVLFRLEITGVGPGETFGFADEYGRSYQIPFSANRNLGAFPVGDNYVFRQTGGPRQCRMTNAAGVVPANPVTINADCSKSGGSGGGTVPPTNSFPAIDLVSRSSDDKIFGTFFETWQPVIGGTGDDEGRYVAFVTYTKGLGGGTGKFRQIVWRDRKTGETRVISRSASGEEGNQNSLSPAISADGKSVAFESYATNLVPVDSNGTRDIFVWNYDRNTVTAVSENRGTEADAQCMEPTISADGSLIAFSSNASNLASGVDGTSTTNVFLRDMRSGAVTLISKNEMTGKGGGGSNPSISEDGSRIAFYNYAPLTKEDKNSLWDIYVWDGSSKLKRISKTTSGGDKDQGDESSSRVVAPSISGNGRYVAFATTATNMVAGDGNGLQDVFVAEVDSGRVVWASSVDGNMAGDGDSPFGQGEKIAISYDGNLVAFSSKAKNLGGNIVIKNLATNRITPVSTDVTSTIGPPSMSRSGYYVIFGTNRQLDSRFSSSGTFVVYSER